MEKISDELYQSMEAKMSSESKKRQVAGPSTPGISPAICRVPESLRKLNPCAYTPEVVSIGPLHQNDPHLIITQDHKLSYMHSLLHRTAKSGDDAKTNQTLRECVDTVVKMTPDARTCYGESLKEDNTDVKLANTLLVDGCFILEFLFRFKDNKIEEIDLVDMNYLTFDGIVRDLILLENQIPFFVLQQLFQRTLGKIPNLSLSLIQSVIQFFGDMMSFEREMTVNNGTTETYDHILGLLHNYYEPASNRGTRGDYRVVKYCATQLQSAGVKFKDSNSQASRGEDYLLVQFRTTCLMISWMQTLHQMVCSWLLQKPTNSDPEQNEAVGTAEERRRRRSHQKPSNCFLFSWLFHLCSTTFLELPKLCITDLTESFLRNLIAYEQCCLTFRRHYFTSYAFLMDTLINSNEDVELLENEGVLQNYLGASKDASDLFNNLCKELFLGEFYYYGQWKQLTDYCNLFWPKHLASLRSTYFSNPWVIISLIGVIILFGLTAVQTVYSIK